MMRSLSCRVCESTNNLQLISQRGNESILCMLQSIASLPIAINDYLPQHICLQCSVELKETYSFQLLYATSSAKMKNMLSARHIAELVSDMHEVKNETFLTRKSENKHETNAGVHESEEKVADFEVTPEDEACARNIQGCCLKGSPDQLHYKEKSSNEIQKVMKKAISTSDANTNTSEEFAEACNLKFNLTCQKQTSLQRSHECRIKSRFLKLTDSKSNEAANSGSEIYIPEGSHVMGDEAPSFKLQEVSQNGSLSENHSEIKIKEASYSDSQSDKCDQCDKSFSTLRSLKRHLALHENPELYMCDECGKFFTSSIAVSKHKVLHSGLTKCNECGKSFSTLKFFKEHVAFHSNPDRNACNVCGKSFTTVSSMREHKKIHSDLLKCEKCGKSFTRSRNLKIHRALHLNPERYKCDVCGKAFTLPETLKVHIASDVCGKSFTTASNMQEHKKIPSGLLKCEKCGKSFTRSRNLKIHSALHLNPERYKCDVCQKAYTHPETLKAHIARHLIPDKCSKSFQSSKFLKRHKVNLALHENPEPYSCDECGKFFASSITLRRHKVLHSGLTKCNECGKSFSTLKFFKDHVAFHSNPNRNSCNVCGKSFTTVSIMREHKKIHFGLHKCEKCGKSFTRYRNLKVHRTLHLNPERYKCDVCGKAYTHPETLKAHKARHSIPNKCGKSFQPSKYLERRKVPHSNLNKCSQCDKSFCTLRSLKRHSALHNSDRNAFDVCGKSFTTASNMQEHKKIPSGLFQCEECGKSFTRSQNLKFHRALHLNPERYKCDVCGKAFTHPNTLKAHIARHSNPDNCEKSFQ